MKKIFLETSIQIHRLLYADGHFEIITNAIGKRVFVEERLKKDGSSGLSVEMSSRGDCFASLAMTQK